MRILAVVAAGGLLGAVARYGIGAAWPQQPGAFTWHTWTINVTGCFLIGVLYALIPAGRRGVRAFLGTGFLGGYTTFSAASVDVLLTRPGVALAYLFGTAAAALLAVWAGTAVVRR